MTWLRNASLIALVAIVMAPGGPAPLTATELGSARADARPTRVSVNRASAVPITEVLHGFGEIRAAQILHLPMPDAQTTVTELAVRPGDLVRAGQVLARLDGAAAARALALAQNDLSAAQANLRIVQAQLAQAEADSAQRIAAHDMLVQLAQAGSSSSAQRQDAQRAMDHALLNVQAAHARRDMALAEADRMRLRVEAATALVGDMVIAAPVDGRVMQVAVEPGTAPAIGAPLISLAVADRMQAVVQVTPAALAQIAPGDPVRLWLPGARMTEGRVARTGPGIGTAGAAPGLSEVIVTLPPGADSGDGPAQASGTALRAEIITDSRSGIVIPVSALVALPDGPGVLRVVDGRAVATPVLLAARPDATGAEILEGLAEGSTYVALAGSLLQAGDAVLAISPGPDRQADAAPRNLWQEASAAALPGQVRP